MPFFDLAASYRNEAQEIDEAVSRVLSSGRWIGGPEVEAFEKDWAEACGARYCVGVGNGTDAITLALWALGIGPGDEVLLPAFSAYPTAVGVFRSGAKAVFVDVNESDALINPSALEASLSKKSKALLPVHLYGNACAMPRLHEMATRHGLKMVEDCAQAHACQSGNQALGHYSQAAAWSFYPTKNLGAAGDAGAVTTNDEDLARKLSRLRNYGQVDRYRHEEAGINSRLDPIQAAILRVRLKHLARKTERRLSIAAKYRERLGRLGGLVLIPQGPPREGNGHLFPVFCGSKDRRERLQSRLSSMGVETLVHYPLAMPQQAATPLESRGSFPVAERLAASELSLPVFPELRDDQVDEVLSSFEKAWLEMA